MNVMPPSYPMATAADKYSQFAQRMSSSSSMPLSCHKALLQSLEAEAYGHGPSPNHTDSEATSCTPASDHTPAMPILGDVTMRSRSLLRDIGSRPLSDDMEKYLNAQGKCRQINVYLF
jgi:hypothetical protein